MSSELLRSLLEDFECRDVNELSQGVEWRLGEGQQRHEAVSTGFEQFKAGVYKVPNPSPSL